MIIPDALIYPGLGFGAVLAKATLKDPDDALLPDFAEAPSVNFEIAVAVAEQAISEGIANVEWDDKEVRERAKELQWLPVYEEYMYDENGEK